MSSLGDTRCRAFRVARIGLVFQSFELVSYLDVFENILLPYRLNSALRLTADVRRRCGAVSRRNWPVAPPEVLSAPPVAGRKAARALCRAALPEPPLLLADEPTGNLDPLAKRQVVDLLFAQIDRTGATLLMVTHDMELAGRFPRVIDCREFGREAVP